MWARAWALLVFAAYLLLTIGSFAILAEIFHPSIAMGIVGVICLVLAFLSLGSLPTNWAVVPASFSRHARR